MWEAAWDFLLSRLFFPSFLRSLAHCWRPLRPFFHFLLDLLTAYPPSLALAPVRGQPLSLFGSRE